MKNVKGVLALVIFILVSLSICPAAGSQKKAEPNRPSAKELLDKFSQLHQNNNFIIKGQVSSKFRYDELNWGGEQYHKFEERYDGTRNKTSNTVWGNVSLKHQNVSEKDAGYSSYLWDGKDSFQYGRSEESTSLGLLKITSKDDMKNFSQANMDVMKYGYTAQSLGYPSFEGQRIDELLKNNSKQLKLRKQTEKIHDANCYVIDADIKGTGKYTIWIDPVHDYHIAKIQIQKSQEGESVGQNKLQKGDYYNETYEVTQFHKVQDEWFPQEMKNSSEHFTFGKHYKGEKIIKFTEVNLKPDHEALKSFVPDDIPNGTDVKLSAYPSGLTFTWQDGKVVDKSGKVIADFKEKRE